MSERDGLIGQDASTEASFAGRAEAVRREGDAERAVRIAREGLRHDPEDLPGRVALGLALMDLEDIEGARREFVRIVDLVPMPGPEAAGAEALVSELAEDEFERAFESAETDPEEMISANVLAEEALRREDSLQGPETDLDGESPPHFVTGTMASLLEEEGDPMSASVPGASLEEGAVLTAPELDAAELPDPSTFAATDRFDPRERTRVLNTLERWLGNIQRGVA